PGPAARPARQSSSARTPAWPVWLHSVTSTARQATVAYDDAAEQRHLRLRQEFLIDPDVVFLNHGSFGACPQPVFERYQAWQSELERQPVEFLGRRHQELMASARAGLAEYLGADADEIVYYPNVTQAVNAV